ncbi:hypothetical protein JHK86_024738 [Glycine max]|nr:hypothetical protein JHK86_024738 [Glycine max]
MKVGLQPKKRPVLKEKCLPPPITLPGYTHGLMLSAIMKLEYCLVTLCTIQSNATPHLEFRENPKILPPRWICIDNNEDLYLGDVDLDSTNGPTI